MKFEPAKLSKVIEQNYSYLIPDFYEMQIQYMNSMSNIYKDLDTTLVAMFLTNKFYQSENKENYLSNNVSTKNFYQKNKFEKSFTKFKVNEISKAINIPRETVRRKKIKLTKNKFIILNKNKKSLRINSSLINKKVFEPQIKASSKLLSNYCIFFSNKNVFNKDLDFVSFKNDIEKKFILYLPIFLNFQISYLTEWRKFMDMECIYIAVLCALNTSVQLRRKSNITNEIFDSKEIFAQIFKVSDKFGLNSTSISEITKIPRTTVLRKICDLEKVGMLKKDKFKRYAPDILSGAKESMKLLPATGYTLELLGIFFSQCFEIYSAKI